ncbi:MAG: hypothetical protein WAP98_09625 [Caldicoprobacterales bacterium]|jgi:hypothetical protein|nr:hypothetical protein [Clostridia bacterium]MDI9512728.1 hypothetical protein [Bacillota bacterium]
MKKLARTELGRGVTGILISLGMTLTLIIPIILMELLHALK